MTAATTPRLRMFAGPNGSGKSTIKSYVGKVINEKLFGYYINPDEFESKIKHSGFLDFNDFKLSINQGEVLDFFRKSEWLKNVGLAAEVAKLEFRGSRLDFSAVSVNSYLASVASDFIRRKLLLSQQTFTFETVMSSPDKVEFLSTAQSSGYRTYLYYVATEDPAINVSRVEIRVRAGGHGVPPEKITTRYHRSLGYLWDAIQHSSRAYVFDNSTVEAKLIAEITDAESIEIKTESVPAWFKKYVLDKIDRGK
jgi:predicted ABC-type ATPase